MLICAQIGIAAHPAPASEAFRPLSIDGSLVRWPHGSPRDVPLLRYAIANRETKRTGAVNCGHTRAPDAIIARTRIDRTAFDEAVREAFARWQRVARLRFVAADEQEAADIVIGEQAEPTGHAFTNLALGGSPRDVTRPIVHATICLNPERRWKIGFDGDLTSYDLVHTLTHEIGHAIGLDHPGARGHVMSFRYDEAHPGLTPGDVLGATTIYGPPNNEFSQGESRRDNGRAAGGSSAAIGRGLSD